MSEGSYVLPEFSEEKPEQPPRGHWAQILNNPKARWVTWEEWICKVPIERDPPIEKEPWWVYRIDRHGTLIKNLANAPKKEKAPIRHRKNKPGEYHQNG